MIEWLLGGESHRGEEIVEGFEGLPLLSDMIAKLILDERQVRIELVGLQQQRCRASAFINHRIIQKHGITHVAKRKRGVLLEEILIRITKFLQGLPQVLDFCLRLLGGCLLEQFLLAGRQRHQGLFRPHRRFRAHGQVRCNQCQKQ